MVKRGDDDDLLSYLRSIDDRNALARIIIEQNLYVDFDPEIVALVRRATIGSGEHSDLLRAIAPASNGAPGRAKRSWRYERIRKHHPALEKLTTEWRRVTEEPMPNVPGPSEEIGADDASDNALDGNPLPEQDLPGPTYRPVPSEWDKDFLKGLKVHLYEKRFELWPDRIGPEKPPPGYIPPGDVPPDSHGSYNPFAPPAKPAPAKQSSSLTALDAKKVFDGMSFAMWKHGKVMNAHVIIVWSMIRNIDEQKGMEILGLYLNEARKWLRVGSRPRRRLVADPRFGEDLHYVWVHENAPGRGFHTHVLMHLPFSLRREFDAWSRSCLIRLCGTSFDWKAFRIVPSYAKDEESQVRGGWRWFRYIMKQLDPATQFRFRDDVEGVFDKLARDVLYPFRARQSIPIPKMKRVGVSHSIGPTAQKNEGFVSKLHQGSFGDLYGGREFHDRRRVDLLKTLEGKDFEWRSEFKR